MIERTTLPFFRGDVQLVGELFRNTDRLDVQQPAIIVTGSWLTVKEQMPETYALPRPVQVSAAVDAAEAFLEDVRR